MTYVIAQPCVDLKDRACVDECPVDCIYEGKRMLYIHPDECVDCGACEPVCPVEAIFYEDDTPEEWKDYYDANVHFFDDLGSPGGAAKMGEIDKDHPLSRRCRRRSTTSDRSGRAGRSPQRLPDFPWDQLTAYAERARAHPDGIVDLSVGTPVDPTPDGRAARRCAAAADSPGYPLTIGRVETRQAARRLAGAPPRRDRARPRRRAAGDRLQGADRRRCRRHLGLGAGRPGRAPGAGLPDVRGRRARWPAPARVATDSLTALGPETPRAAVAELARPTRPAGCCRVEHLRKVVDWCRERGTLLVSDECYLECAWEAEPVSVLHPDVCGGSHEGILAVHSLSKRSNLAGYRCALRRRRPGAWSASCSPSARTSGCMMPGPQQVAMVAALDDDAHVDEQHARYAARRATLRDGARGAPASGSTTPRRRSTSGPPATRTAGTPSPGSPSAASWSPRARSTAAPAPGTCGSPSPRPTSGSPPRPRL